MRHMISEIINIIAGLVLTMGLLPSIPGIGKDLQKLAKWFGGFQTIIGVIAISIGVLGLL